MTDLIAPQVGLEPTTTRLTAECSAIELLRIMESGSDLSSRAVSSQVLSALESLRQSRTKKEQPKGRKRGIIKR